MDLDFDPSKVDPHNVPMHGAPDGEVTNLINPYSRSWMARVAVYTTLPLPVIFISLRAYARIRRRHEIGWDDGLFLIGGVSIYPVYWSHAECLAICHSIAMLVVGLHDEFGRHYWDAPLSIIGGDVMRLYAVLPLVYCITTMFIKISLLALFLRIFSPSRIVRRMIWIGLVFITLSFSAAAIAYIVFFFPPSSGEGWSDPKIARQRADSTAYINLILGALGASTDFYVIAIPITAVSSLNLSKKKKIGVSALFATGLMACGMCVAALVPKVQYYKDAIIMGVGDTLYTLAVSNALSVAEVNLGTMCASLPVVFPLLGVMVAYINATTSSWGRYLSRRRTSPVESDSSTISQSRPKRLSPEFPNAKLKTLMSFVRGKEVSKNQTAQGSVSVTKTTDIEMAPYSELRSVDIDYHAYLGGKAPSSYTASARTGQR